MTKRSNRTTGQPDLAPELHNDEQDDARSQAQQVATDAQDEASSAPGGTESRKPASPGVDNVAGTESDLIDEMRRMEDSGMIDNSAFAGEPNHDDEAGTYGGETTDGEGDDYIIADGEALSEEEE